jgi:glycosyltransferase involved in cell wall biosynthesis
MSSRPLRVLSAIMFFPRGGSAFVVRALARGLRQEGERVTVLSGSRSGSEHADAQRFYEGLDVRAVDFSAALASEDPLRFEPAAGGAPIHPSFEDRPGAPDRVFAALDDADFERQVQPWARELARAGAADCDVLHLHHLTPLNEAAARVAPRVPVVGHLHGTELLMLERIDEGAPAAWAYAGRWAERLRQWASRCERLIVAPGGTRRAASLLGVPAERFHELPNGFDPERFRRRELDRRAVWRKHLVEHPRGWLPDGEPGGVVYAEGDLVGLDDGPVLLYSGRFTAVKRLELMIEAYAEARPRLAVAAPLVLVGGYPGEWEGEHPAQTIERVGVDGVFLAGWHDQSELPELLSAADVLLMPSAREHFGQVIVEAMACGVPAIAARSPGPLSIIEDGQSGWLVPIDDQAALTDAIVCAVNDPDERARRAREARRVALERYSWPAIASELADLLREAGRRGPAQSPGSTGSPLGARARAEAPPDGVAAAVDASAVEV